MLLVIDIDSMRFFVFKRGLIMLLIYALCGATMNYYKLLNIANETLIYGWSFREDGICYHMIYAIIILFSCKEHVVDHLFHVLSHVLYGVVSHDWHVYMLIHKSVCNYIWAY